MEMSMKCTKILLLIVLAVLAMGCKKDKKKGLDITGTWELVDMKTKAIQIGEETIEVVMTFNADNTFSLEQKLGAGRFQSYSGTWQLADTKLSGKYSDGKAWGAAYEVGREGAILTMTPDVEGAESYVYQKK
jgi:hypothetical protein